MKKIGIVGLGIMGKGMAVNFLKNNYKVYVWNRTKSVSESIDGATICISPKQVAEKADIIFEVTANDESSRQVWTNDEGVLAGADPSKTLIISSTVSIEWINKLDELCNEKGFTLLDVPLTGGRIGAETGNLTLLCGGEEKIVEKLKPIFKAIASNVLYFGPSGHGMKYKLILNFLQGAHLIAFGQAIKLAKTAGMDVRRVADGLAWKPGGIVTEIAKRTYFQDPDPITFSIEWITKDLNYAKKFSKEFDLDLSILESTLKEYEKVVSEHKDKDWASVNRLLKQK